MTQSLVNHGEGSDFILVAIRSQWMVSSSREIDMIQYDTWCGMFGIR